MFNVYVCVRTCLLSLIVFAMDLFVFQDKIMGPCIKVNVNFVYMEI